MSRPPTGTLRPLRDGRVRVVFESARVPAGLRSVTFSDPECAERWRAAVTSALAGNRSLPKPSHYQRRPAGSAPRLTDAQKAQTPVELGFQLYVEHTYEARAVADVERAAAVERLWRLHLAPYLGSRGIAFLQQVDGPTVLELSLRLAGRGEDVRPPEAHGGARGIALLTDRQAADLCRTSKSGINRARRAGTLVSEPFPDGRHGYRPKALENAGLLRSEPRPAGLNTRTGRDVLNLLRAVLGFARTLGAKAIIELPDKSWAATKPYERDQARPRPVRDGDLSLEEAARVAAVLPVIHQVTFWMLYLLAPRKGEPYGPLVGDWVDAGPGAGGLLVIERQGGRSFRHRDRQTGQVVVSASKSPKTEQSVRTVAVPEALAVLLRAIIAAFHTDSSGQIDLEARLVPVINTATGTQASFTAALTQALRVCGLPHRTPKDLRSQLASTLHDTGNLPEWAIRRLLGHESAGDVHGRYYHKDTDELVQLRRVAEVVNALVLDALPDGLLQPTTARHTFTRSSPHYARVREIDARLQELGWHTTTSGDDCELLTVAQVAAEIGLSEPRTRDRLARGDIRSLRCRRGGKLVYLVERGDLDRYLAEHAGRRNLAEVAADLAVDYHVLYRLAGDLGLRHDAAGRELLLGAEAVEALQAELARRAARDVRSVTVAVAAAQLRLDPRTVRARMQEGALELDPDWPDYVTRVSLETFTAGRLGADRQRLLARGWITDEDLGAHSGLDGAALRALARAGYLQPRRVGSRTYYSQDSVRRWAAGFRPDLLSWLDQIAPGAAPTGL